MEEIRCIMVIVVASRKYTGEEGKVRIQWSSRPNFVVLGSWPRYTCSRMHMVRAHHPLLPHPPFPSRIPRTYVLSRSLYLCASIKPYPPISPPFTTAYLRVVTRVSVREIPKGGSLFRLIATNSAQTTSTPLVDTDLLLSLRSCFLPASPP